MEALVAAGVDTVILAVSYRAELLEQEMARHADQLGKQRSVPVERENASFRSAKFTDTSKICFGSPSSFPDGFMGDLQHCRSLQGEA